MTTSFRSVAQKTKGMATDHRRTAQPSLQQSELWSAGWGLGLDPQLVHTRACRDLDALFSSFFWVCFSLFLLPRARANRYKCVPLCLIGPWLKSGGSIFFCPASILILHVCLTVLFLLSLCVVFTIAKHMSVCRTIKAVNWSVVTPPPVVLPREEYLLNWFATLYCHIRPKPWVSASFMIWCWHFYCQHHDWWRDWFIDWSIIDVWKILIICLSFYSLILSVTDSRWVRQRWVSPHFYLCVCVWCCCRCFPPCIVVGGLFEW